MDSETINGLHSCKPGNEPSIGQTKTFLIEERTGKTGKPYIKVKSASPDSGGAPYKILKAVPTGFTDQHGNVSFNIELEKVAGNGIERIVAPPTSFTGHPDDRSKRIERQSARRDAIEFHRLETLGKGEREVSVDRVKELMGIFEGWLDEQSW